MPALRIKMFASNINKCAQISRLHKHALRVLSSTLNRHFSKQNKHLQGHLSKSSVTETRCDDRVDLTRSKFRVIGPKAERNESDQGEHKKYYR